MPGMDGVMLGREIRKRPGLNSMPLVLLTSMCVRVVEPGIVGIFTNCMTKPIKPALLYEVLQRAISGGKVAPEKQPARKAEPALASRLPLNILLCDDNTINQKVAMRLVQQMGYQADLASNGLEALAAIDKKSYDLIFMDVMMPEMGGLDAPQEIRRRQEQPADYPNYKSPIIIVAMTANAMPG